MKSQITMKDIANHFGVSLNTVHKSISGKPGVSENTRKKIVDYANKNGYKHNTMAAYLKKKVIRIAVCLPEVDENSKYFYYFIWKGYRKFLKEWSGINIQIDEVPYKKEGLAKALIRIGKAYDEGNKIDGILTVPPWDKTGIHAIEHLTDKGVCVVFVTGDNSTCNRWGFVSGNYYSAGQIMAEQICNILQPGSRILLMVGDEYRDSHYMAAKGFHEYVRQNQRKYNIENVFGFEDLNKLETSIQNMIKANAPDGICCVFARGSAVLLKALHKSGMAGKIPVIANDVFHENIIALKEGTFTNLVFNDPYKQAYMAMKMLCEYLIMDIHPKTKGKMVETILVFKSNVNDYWKSS